MFVPFPLPVRRELRSMTAAGGWVDRNQERKNNRNRRKELTNTMPIPTAMGVDVILCLYSVLFPNCVNFDCVRAVSLIIKPADHSVGDWCRRR